VFNSTALVFETCWVSWRVDIKHVTTFLFSCSNDVGTGLLSRHYYRLMEQKQEAQPPLRNRSSRHLSMSFCRSVWGRESRMGSTTVSLRYRRYPGNAKKPISNTRFSFDAPLQGTHANVRTTVILPETRLSAENFFAADSMPPIFISLHAILLFSKIAVSNSLDVPARKQNFT